MLQIEYPHFAFKIKDANGKKVIFDVVRKKWVRLTPEEWVRQNFIQYLLQSKNYPACIIAIEKEIKLGDLRKRCDIVVYKSHTPWMIVECKEQDTPLTDSVIAQVLRYNITLDTSFVVLTNGNEAYAYELKGKEAVALDTLPGWTGYSNNDM